ncbi:MAG: transposase [bacterium]|nr:transposase [bacterium]
MRDGASGFWAALAKVYPTSREHRFRMHKTANVIEKLPQNKQGRAKRALHDIYLAESRQAANKAFDNSLDLYRASSPRRSIAWNKTATRC